MTKQPDPVAALVKPKSDIGPIEWAQRLLVRCQTYGAGETWGFRTTSEASLWNAHVSAELRRMRKRNAELSAAFDDLRSGQRFLHARIRELEEQLRKESRHV